jgi:hypothetical protein
MCFCLYVTLLMFDLFFFFDGISNLVMQVIGNVNTHFMNTHKKISGFVNTYNLNFEEWYHGIK